MDWISVEDRLPEEFVNVIGYLPEIVDGDTEAWTVAECIYVFKQWKLRGEIAPHFVPPTHWMPLPEPPTP